MTLPKFLLAWSDINWFWLHAHLRPAKDARWTLARTLGLTAVQAIIGAVLGLLLAFIFFRAPVGWLPWLLGLWRGCVGLCWFGITAICWNQRAVQLRASHAVATVLPKARYPFFRWCLGFVYFALLGVITPFALMVTVENIRGEITWNRERARLVAAGEKLAFREILGPEIPAAQNAGAAPVFAPFFDYKKDSGPHDQYRAMGQWPVVWPSSNALARIEFALYLPEDYLPKSVKQRKTEPQTPTMNLDDWSVAFRTLVAKPKTVDNVPPKEIRMPEPGNSARDVLAGLVPAEPVLSEICAAAALPRSQFPIHYDDSFDALLPHLGKMKTIQRLLELRCAAHLAAGETDAAFVDATNALNVADLLREEPLLISQLVRYAQINIAVSTLWQGLAEHRWSDAQLAEFQRRLSKFDCAPSIVLAMEGERACGISGLDRIVNDPRAYDSFMGPPPGIVRVLRLIPRSVLRQNQATMAHYESAALVNLRQAISNAPQTGLTTAVQSREAKLENYISSSYSPYTAMFAMLAPATGKAINKTARAETAVDLAITACALERYRIAHGEFPENLEQLAPRFAASVPHDPMVNQPFHYSRTDDGWFQLYSVGPNGKDEGGAMFSSDKGDKDEKDWPWPVPARPTHPRLF